MRLEEGGHLSGREVEAALPVPAKQGTRSRLAVWGRGVCSNAVGGALAVEIGHEIVPALGRPLDDHELGVRVAANSLVDPRVKHIQKGRRRSVEQVLEQLSRLDIAAQHAPTIVQSAQQSAAARVANGGDDVVEHRERARGRLQVVPQLVERERTARTETRVEPRPRE